MTANYERAFAERQDVYEACRQLNGRSKPGWICAGTSS
jgi:hypothetical protein